jgi:hypothetical protein
MFRIIRHCLDTFLLLASEFRPRRWEGTAFFEGRNPKAELAKLSGIGSALNTEATGASVSRNDRTE